MCLLCVSTDSLAILSEGFFFFVVCFLQYLLTNAGVVPYFLDHETEISEGKFREKMFYF
jgi:hypothetical protein